MAPHWTGRLCWAAATALLFDKVNANSAIVTTMTEHGIYDVALNITQLELLPGLASWDDLAFNSIQEPRFSQHANNMALEMLEMLAVLDIASGTRCESTPGCMDNIASHYQTFLANEAATESQPLEKRFRYIYKWINKGWKTSKNNPITTTALGALSSVVGGSTDAIIQLTRSAICATDGGHQACLSWAGGVQAIKKGIALDIIGSAQGTFGQDAVSGEEYAAVFASSTRRKRSLRKRAQDVCISDRPKHCT